MAELFKPEIKDVGGTNVTAYSPPSMDYSGIFNSLARTIDSFEREKTTAPKLSEAEEKNLVLEPYISKVQKIMSSDDIPEVKKYALVNGIRTEVARKYSAYNDVFEKSIDSSLKILDPDGDPIQKEYENMAKWGETETGVFARAQSINLAIDKEGSFDEGLYQTKMRELYYKDIQDTNRLAVQKRRNEIYKEESGELYRTEFVPSAMSDIRADIQTFSTGIAQKTLLDRVKAGKALPMASQEAAEALLLADEVAMLKKRWDSELTRRKVAAGYSVNDPNFSNDALLIELTNLEEAFRGSATSVSKVLSSMNEQVSTAYIANMPEAQRIAYEANKSSPPAIANHIALSVLSIPENIIDIENYTKKFRLPTYDFNIPMVGSEETSSLPRLPVGPDMSVQSVQTQLPEFNPQMVTEVLPMPTGAKKNLIERTGISIENSVVSDAETASTISKDLSASYLTIATRLSGDAEVGVTPLDQTKIFFGPKAMNLISEIEKKDPVAGKTLYNQVNKSIQTETLRQFIFLETSLNRTFPNNPFVLKVNDKGMVGLDIDPRARKEDPSVMQLAQMGFETPDEILNSINMVWGTPASLVKGMKQSIESLNTYLMAANKFPDSLKNSPDFAGVFIRERLAALPKYTGANVTITSPVVGQ